MEVVGFREGKTDTVTVKCMQQNEIVADAFNSFIYGGKHVIDPDSLEKLDTREIGVPYGGEGRSRAACSANEGCHQIRDGNDKLAHCVLRCWQLKARLTSITQCL